MIRAAGTVRCELARLHRLSLFWSYCYKFTDHSKSSVALFVVMKEMVVSSFWEFVIQSLRGLVCHLVGRLYRRQRIAGF